MPERLYEIVMQRPTTIIGATNLVQPGIELHVQARGDISFILDVPANADPSYIDRAIRMELDKRISIAQLGEE